MPRVRLAYLTAHYPNVAHAFIQGEIFALERLGAEILRIALNTPDPADIISDDDRAEKAKTFYVKGTPKLLIAWRLSTITLCHPLAFTRCALTALRAGGPNIGMGVKLVLQLLEAMLVWRHCRRHGISAVHAHFGQAPASVASLTTMFGNAVGREHWTWSATIHGSHEFFNEDTSRVYEKIAHADLVVCISDFTRAQLMRIASPEDWPKITIVRCGIDFNQFAARPHHPSRHPPVIVTTARLSREKGHLVLVEAVAILRELGVDVRVRMIGSGPFRDEIERAIMQHDVADVVDLTGPLPPDRVADELRDADVFCLPTFFEGLPISIMEAMAIGVPVVTTYVGAIPELVVDGVTGWVVPAGNPHALVDAIRMAVIDQDEVVKAARAKVYESHDRVANVAELLPLLAACHRR